MGSCSWSSLVLPHSPSSWSNCLDRWFEWFSEDSVAVPAKQWHLARLGSVLPCVVYALNQHHVSPKAWVWESKNKGINKVISLPINPRDPVVKCLLPIPAASASAGLEVLVTKGEMLSPGETAKIALNWNLKLPSGHWALNQQRTGWVTEPDYQGKIGLLLLS